MGRCVGRASEDGVGNGYDAGVGRGLVGREEKMPGVGGDSGNARDALSTTEASELGTCGGCPVQDEG